MRALQRGRTVAGYSAESSATPTMAGATTTQRGSSSSARINIVAWSGDEAPADARAVIGKTVGRDEASSRLCLDQTFRLWGLPKGSQSGYRPRLGVT